MARYIDADAFKQKLADKDIFFPALYENELNEMPTADVAPKSEVAMEISKDIIEPLWAAYKNSESKETVLLVALICESINAQLKKKYTEGAE